MGRIITAYPSLSRTVQTVTLGGKQYRLSLSWFGRLKAWYMSLETLAGEAIVTGRRLSPGYGPMFGLLPENAPDGLFFVRGRDGYEREDFGDDVVVVYYERDDVTSTDTTDDVRVVLA